MIAEDKLWKHLANLPPGPIVARNGLDRLLAECWDSLQGDDGGMAGYKLLGRMENVRWEPPVLSFTIERHGGTVCGSTRAELQHWSVDVDQMTATITKTGHRQLEPMARRVSVKATAEELAQAILGGKQDDRLRWCDDGSVRVLASAIYSKDSGFKMTVEGRRRRLSKQVERIIGGHGWRKIAGNQFSKLGDDAAVTREMAQ